MNDSLIIAARLDDLAIVEVSGADAAAFLQGQLTQDIAALGADRASPAGYCSPKGRLIASMIVWHANASGDDTFCALVKQDIAREFAARLSKYVLRAKVAIGSAPARITGVLVPGTDAARKTLAGIAGASAQVPAESLPPGGLPSLANPYDIVRTDAGTCIAAPSGDSGVGRWWMIEPDPHASRPDPERQQALPDAGAALWQAQDIAAGLAWIVAATQELFIPQTLNMDLTGGINFGKGCYPGQEIVARSHYRGTVKRRMAHGTVDGDDAAHAAGLPGTDVFDANRPDTPCGRVINAAVASQTHILFETALADLGQADFRLHSVDGPVVRMDTLPYEIKPAG